MAAVRLCRGYDAEAALLVQIRVAKLPMPATQFPWATIYGRNWKADFAWPVHQLLVEIDGAPHRIKKRFLADQEKRLAATAAGWRLISFSPAMVRSGLAFQWLQEALEGYKTRRADSPRFPEILRKHGIFKRNPTGGDS